MALAMLCFITNDTIIKVLGETVPLGQMLVVRGVFAVVILAGFVALGPARRQLRQLGSGPVVLRAGADVITTFLFLTALLNMDIANATAILQAAPFAVIVLAAVFLGERTGWRRFSAVAVGFIGVLIVVRPAGEGFNAYGLVAVAAMLFVALRDVLTRRIPLSVPSSIIALANGLAVLVGGLGLMLFETPVALGVNQLALLLASAVMLAAAYFLMVLAIRAADMATTAPFRYTVIVWSLLSGYFVFGSVPQVSSFAGIALIAGSGIYAVWRDARVRALAVKNG